MSGQRGSVLIGVMAMSLVMTLAAGGFILLIANTAKDEESANQDFRLHYAAEGGLQRAVRLIRNYDTTALIDGWPPMEKALTPGTPGSEGFVDSDGLRLRVSLLRAPGAFGLPGTPGRDQGTLKAWATAGENRDTLVITWQIDSVAWMAPVGGMQSRVYLSNWQETFIPAAP